MHSTRASFVFGFLALGLTVANATTRANEILNGSFESGPALAPAGITQLNPGDLPSWTLNGGAPMWAWYMSSGPSYGVAEDGTKFINLTSPSLSQNFGVAAGNTYTVSYYEAIRADGGGQPDTVTASVSLAAGTATGTTSQIANNPLTNSSVNNWEQFSFSFTPSANTTATLQFALTTGHGYAGYPVLDNVVMTSVPEPASLALCGIGGVGLLAIARPRRRV